MSQTINAETNRSKRARHKNCCGSMSGDCEREARVWVTFLVILGVHDKGEANLVFGLMAYHVTRRTAEMGLRMALGATRRQIAGSILQEAVILAGCGVAAGIPLTLALTQIIRGNLYGVGPSDPTTLCVAVGLLVGVALLAAWIPAYRAMKVDPIVALRAE